MALWVEPYELAGTFLLFLPNVWPSRLNPFQPSKPLNQTHGKGFELGLGLLIF
ncbi:hypothetical protein BDA96_04G157400 [Sorghum bicolor]|uniref:Uncharacterized protein n=1 Tax=Sorghum bicolor TaxID=4558 RepID=A0A921R320_SORBI|nr:hypothetical protein BDA96_04G157400 [Sorghum bicolor]